MLSRSPYTLSGYVWIFSGICLLIYAIVGLVGYEIPGIEQAAFFLSSVEGYAVFWAAFFVILIEGIYLIGNFFPGSTILIMITLGAKIQNTYAFLGAIISIIIGWCLAGGINVIIGRLLRLKYASAQSDARYKPNLNSQKWITWFPAFRSNYEVAQVIEGNSLTEVLVSSSKIKLITSVGMMLVLYVSSFFVNVSTLDNSEGFKSLIIISAICFIVGTSKIINKRLDK